MRDTVFIWLMSFINIIFFVFLVEQGHGILSSLFLALALLWAFLGIVKMDPGGWR